MYFSESGAHNTDKTLDVAFEEARARGISHVVVASTSGSTGVKAARKFKGASTTLVVVSHNVGFGKDGKYQMEAEKREEIERLGAKVHCGTMVLRGLGTAIRQRSGNFSHEELVATTLRMFGQGIKVCVEISAMAADAGLVPFDDVICVAGTGRGADACVLLKANSSNGFFDIKVKEILAKPASF